ncbi:aminopeptidase N [Phocoenobacter skyensis]|uniref:Aminopeptidase N n=1 Tax=Phocoenobacter skyensis TaxID=97481 RepID=A0A1H7VYU6_9PAST|nr:aminopeptidase N [Pasteurella skyensis]MDP8079061.1 aminopeptidase N [Pasteurella skyensis]MDP8085011.1 aminopeptidase N [Pasteurella skyensis]MDP8174253.1 aminopeptidase N [Pasteurella skyensis]MDP8184932.1 aminopeptidase N [Pasteurella skyensis]QLB21764.1 aminopeptidase N [Pasteurella skyensis]
MQPKAKHRKDYQVPDFTISEIYLDFQLDATVTIVTSYLTVIRKKPQATHLRLDGHSFEFLSLKYNGVEFPHFTQDKESLTLDLTNYSDKQFELEIRTALNPSQNSSLQGLYKSGDGICTQCESEGFRQITYMLDRPDVLAKYTTKVTASKTQFPILLSNGNRIAQGELEDDRHWVKWQDPFLKPSYLFALVAGDFDLLADTFTTMSGRKVALEIYVDKGNLDRASWAMESLKRAMKWDEERFGLEYDLDIYMIVAVDFFNMGAMENKGLNIFNSKYVLANPQTATDKDYIDIESVIGHEYFHNWTGNRITCRDWFQLSLKEGLTVFRDQEFTSDLWSRSVKRIEDVKLLRSVQFAEDASPMAHPIRPEKVIEMNNFYTVTVYEKGAEVIRMIHTLLGEEKFQKGMQLYITENDSTAATCEDFISAMERASDIDLTQFRRWYSQSGTPELTISDEYDERTYTYRLQVAQNTAATADQLDKVCLHIPLKIQLYSQEKGKRVKLQYNSQTVSDVLDVTQNYQVFEFHNIKHRPVPALLCDFSAPVRLDYNYSNEQLLLLLKYAENDFVCWDTMQTLFNNELHQNLIHYQQNEELILSDSMIEAIHFVLSAQKDTMLTALMLTLPKETEFAELFKVIDPEGITAVHHFMQKSIAKIFRKDLLNLYHQNETTTYQITAEDIAKRALRNTCLSYLAFLKQGNSLVLSHYQSANNMTDTLAALSLSVKAQLACRDELLSHFEEKWHHDGLVMDKWFMIQGMRPDENALETVQHLLDHPSFNFKNPNRVRALIGAFSSQNLRAFHSIDGSGYRFLVEILIKMNKINPQVSARLIEPLIKFSRYDNQRQTLMRRGLKRLLDMDNLAKDLFEKIDKALQ